MRVRLAYGANGLDVDLPTDNVLVVEPEFVPALPDPAGSIRAALRQPIGTRPLRDLVGPNDTVAVVFSDITRPAPNRLLVPILLSELSHVPRSNIVLINALGTHRPQTPRELEAMLGRDIVAGYRVVQSRADADDQMVRVGTTGAGTPASVLRAYATADVRILTGLIEPHFFAGFSGGPKAVLPGIASMDTIRNNHSVAHLDHPNATWGVTQGNPVYDHIREVAWMTAPTFCLNVAVNARKEVTGVFAGDVWEAHRVGVEFVRRAGMQPVPQLFDIVITTNSGYPLDINLYQAIKGMSAAAQVVRTGGAIIAAAECREGIPEHGAYKDILRRVRAPRELRELISRPGFWMQDQWNAQVQAKIQEKARVFVRSDGLSDNEVRSALFEPSRSVGETVRALLAEYGRDAAICVLPEGPQTIPYLDTAS